MPTPGGSKPYPLNRALTLKLASGVSHPGRWDGVNWWVQTGPDGPFVPVPQTYIKEWQVA